jgi:hypothetical protein
MNIIMTIEEYEKIKRLSDVADWYLDDHQPTSAFYQEQYEEDKEDILQAQEVFQRIDATLLTTPTFEPAKEEV